MGHLLLNIVYMKETFALDLLPLLGRSAEQTGCCDWTKPSPISALPTKLFRYHLFDIRKLTNYIPNVLMKISLRVCMYIKLPAEKKSFWRQGKSEMS